MRWCRNTTPRSCPTGRSKTWRQPSQPERWTHTTADDVSLIDLKEPDAFVAVELVGDEYGVGMITRTTREHFPFCEGAVIKKGATYVSVETSCGSSSQA